MSAGMCSRRGCPVSIVAPQGRQHLAADALWRLVQNGCARLPDHRPADTEISLTEALRSAFALLSLKSPSLLAFDKERAAGNLETIYGMDRVPCDTRMRALLAPMAPEALRPGFKRIVRQLQRGKALAPMEFLAGPY
jgi:hypothetical protein